MAGSAWMAVDHKEGDVMMIGGATIDELDEEVVKLLRKDGVIKDIDEYGDRFKHSIRSWVRLGDYILAELIICNKRIRTVEYYPHGHNCHCSCHVEKRDITEKMFITRLVLISLSPNKLCYPEHRHTVVDEYDERYDEANNDDCYSGLAIEFDEPFITVKFCKNSSNKYPLTKHFRWRKNIFEAVSIINRDVKEVLVTNEFSRETTVAEYLEGMVEYTEQMRTNENICFQCTARIQRTDTFIKLREYPQVIKIKDIDFILPAGSKVRIFLDNDWKKKGNWNGVALMIINSAGKATFKTVTDDFHYYQDYVKQDWWKKM